MQFVTGLWLVVCTIGFTAGLLVFVDGVFFLHKLQSRPQYAQLIPSHKADMLRDALLALALGLFGSASLISIAIAQPVRRVLIIATLMAGIVLLTAKAVGNYLLRHGFR